MSEPTQDSPAVRVARAHVSAWCRHDWDMTRELLAPTVHAAVTTTQPGLEDGELSGIDAYMAIERRPPRSSSWAAFACSRPSATNGVP